ncbi:MAG TPA: DUF1559 domain-containing protein [Pirellulales bacterium]|nr:DUF1559 domain-containing protein [Pirellulales bacterium]
MRNRVVARRTTPTKRRAFTIIELLVVIAVIGLLGALLLSAVQESRESSRRAACSNKLKQIGVAIGAFESSKGRLPHGMRQRGFSFLTEILPQIEMPTVYEQIDFGVGVDDPRNTTVLVIRMPAFACPSDSSALEYISPVDHHVRASYAGNFGCGVQTFGYNGFFRYFHLDGALHAADIRDGLSHTVAVSELLVSNGAQERGRVIWNTPNALTSSAELDAFAGLCRSMTLNMPADMLSRGSRWTWGSLPYAQYNHVLRPNENSCYNGTHTQLGGYSAASLHPGGVNALLGDGSVTFVSDSIDLEIWRALGSRNGNEAFSF